MRLFSYLNEKQNELDLDVICKVCKPFLTDWKKFNNFSNIVLYRGMDNVSSMPEGFVKFNRIINRQPIDSNKTLHLISNEIYKQKLGIGLRSESTFCSADKKETNRYGTSYGILPIGKYALYSNPVIHDYFKDFDPSVNDAGLIVHYKKLGIFIEKILKSFKIDIKDLKKPIKEGSYYSIFSYLCDPQTVMLYDTDSYYGDKVKEFPMYLPLIKKLRQELELVIAKTKKVSLSDCVKWQNEVMLVCDSYYIFDSFGFDCLKAELK